MNTRSLSPDEWEVVKPILRYYIGLGATRTMVKRALAHSRRGINRWRLTELFRSAAFKETIHCARPA